MALKVFVGQTALRTKLFSGIDLTGVQTAEIKYIKPAETPVVDTWPAIIELPESYGAIYFDATASTDIDVAGEWKIWAYITFLDGRVAPGDATTFKVYEEGSI